MSGFLDKIGDLTWMGDPQYEGCGWIEVGDAPVDPIPSTSSDTVWAQAKKMLAESDWTMLSDVPMTSGERAAWIAYRKSLREIRLQPGFPSEVQWPKTPD